MDVDQVLHRDPLAAPRLQQLLVNLRQQLGRHGGPAGLARAFRLADVDHNGGLDVDELESLLNRCRVFVSRIDLSRIMAAFDADGSGRVEFGELQRALAPPLEGRRRAVVEKAFQSLDRDGSGVATAADLRGRYSVAQHPRVLSGQLSEDEALGLFLQQFDGDRGSSAPEVTWAEFAQYYTNLSVSLINDDQFVQIVESAWCVSERPVDADSLGRIEALLRDKMAAKTGNSGDDAACRMAMRKLFAFFDKNDSGAVELDEFLQVTRRLGVPLERAHAAAFFARYDADSSGALSYGEFTERLFSR